MCVGGPIVQDSICCSAACSSLSYHSPSYTLWRHFWSELQYMTAPGRPLSATSLPWPHALLPSLTCVHAQPPQDTFAQRSRNGKATFYPCPLEGSCLGGNFSKQCAVERGFAEESMLCTGCMAEFVRKAAGECSCICAACSCAWTSVLLCLVSFFFLCHFSPLDFCRVSQWVICSYCCPSLP